jgi:hypothetical protein
MEIYHSIVRTLNQLEERPIDMTEFDNLLTLYFDTKKQVLEEVTEQELTLLDNINDSRYVKNGYLVNIIRTLFDSKMLQTIENSPYTIMEMRCILAQVKKAYDGLIRISPISIPYNPQYL